jgi:hypothetical protein
VKVFFTSAVDVAFVTDLPAAATVLLAIPQAMAKQGFEERGNAYCC